MALKTFNVQGGLSIGNKGDILDANANLNLSNNIANVTLGNVGNLHIAGGNANSAILGSVTLNVDGNVTAIAISSRGDGYTIAPSITISGANSAAANATVSLFANGAINTITINDPGTGYSSGTVSAAVSGPSSRYLRTDGFGNLSWFEVQGTGGGGAGGTPGGSNTYIQFNDNGAFNGTDGFIFDKTSNAVTANGNITAASFITSGSTGNITGANVITANTFTTNENGKFVVVSNNGTELHQIAIQGSTAAGFTANYTLTLPTTDGQSGEVLSTNGSGVLTWINVSPSSISNGNSNVSVATDANVTISANGNANIVTVTSSGDGNLQTTGVNVSGYINSSANIIAANFVGKFANGNSNIAITSNANVTITANSNAVVAITSTGDGNLQTTGGNVTGYWNVSGNIISANFVGKFANGNSNIAIASNANITLTANSNAVVVVTSSGDGNLQTTGGNVTGYWNVSGNAIATNFVGKLANGNSNVVITSNANVTITANGNSVVAVTSSGDGNLQTTGGNVTGYWNVSGNVIGANLVGILANGNANIRIGANANVGISANGQGNILLITSNGTFAQSTIQNDVTITGNLIVTGTAIYSNTSTLIVEDPIISLGTGANGSILTAIDGKDRGLELHTYGNGAAYTTSGSTPSGNTTIVLVSTSGIVAGQLVTIASNPNAIPIGTTVSTVNAGNIIINTPTTDVIAGASTLAIGNDVLRFMGWSNANSEFQFYSNATIINEIVSGTLGNAKANTFIGAVLGNLVNGNSNVTVAANANVQIAANGNSLAAFTSSGDGNLQTTGANIFGYLTTTGNINTSANFVGTLANGNSNVAITANANVTITANSNAIMVITGTGANITGTANVSGNANVGNLGTNIAVITTGNITTGNITTINTGLVQNGNSNIVITTNSNITLTANGNSVVAVTSSGDGNVQTTGANITGYVNTTGNVTASNLVVKASGSLSFTTGNSNVGSNTITTTTTAANQAIAKITAANGRAVEFIVKGVDSTGLKYSAATILALIGNASNADCDFTAFAQLNTGLTTGEITVALTDSNANLTLQVTPSSTNSTVWTTQYRVI